MTKITKKDNFKRIIGVLEAQGLNDLVEVMQHEIDLIEKKANSNKMTKTQEANVATKDLIVSELTRLAKAMTITELLGESEAVAEAVNNSNQKASALMTQLKNAGIVERVQEGKRATFKIAE